VLIYHNLLHLVPTHTQCARYDGTVCSKSMQKKTESTLMWCVVMSKQRS